MNGNLPPNDKELSKDLFSEKDNLRKIVEEKIKEIEELFDADSSLAERIVDNIKSIAKNVEDVKIIQSFIEIVKSYSKIPRIALAVSEEFLNIIMYDYDYKVYKDVEPIKLFIEAYSNKTVKDFLSKVYEYDPNMIKEIVGGIRRIVNYTRSVKVVEDVIKNLQNYENLFLFVAEIGDIAETLNRFKKKYSVVSPIIRSIAKVLKYYKDLPISAKEIVGTIREISREISEGTVKDLYALNFAIRIFGDKKVKKTIKVFENLTQDQIIVGNIVWGLGNVAWIVENVQLVRFLARILRKFKDSRETALVIAWGLGGVAKYTKDLEAVKLLLNFLKKKGKSLPEEKLEEFFTLMYNIAEEYSDEEKTRDEGSDMGALLIKAATKMYLDNIDILSLAPEQLKKYNMPGLNEMLKYILLSFEWLDESEKERLSFKKLLKLLIRNKYWEDEEIKKVLRKMEKHGINIEKLKGSFWIYKLDGGEIPEYKFEQAVEDLVICTLGSRDPKKFEESYKRLSEYVGKEKVDVLRGFVRGEPKNRLIQLYKERKFDEIIDLYERLAYEMRRRNIIRESVLENVLDTLQAIKALKRGVMKGKYIIGFYGKYLPMLFSNESTMNCAMLPEGANRYGSVLYLLDPRILLIGYVITDEYERGKELEIVRERGELDGVVIGYIGLYKGKPALIVDSVEGGREFREFAINNYQKIMNDIHRVAKELGIKYVIYNVKVLNETPRKFLERIEGGVGKYEVEIIGDVKLPYDYTEFNVHYLEAFGGWNVPKEAVKGVKYEIY